MIDFKSFEAGIRIAPESSFTSDPVSGKVGQIYWNITRSVLRICVDSSPTWQDLFIHRSVNQDATLRWDAANDRYTQNYDLLINSSTIYAAAGISGLDIEIKGGDSSGALTDGAKIKLTGGAPGAGGTRGIIEVNTPKIKQLDAATGIDLNVEAGDATALGNPGGDLNLRAGLGVFSFTPGLPEISDVIFTADTNGDLINEVVEWSTPGGDYYAWMDTTIPAVAEITEIEINSTGLGLQSTQFSISSADGNDYYVWMNVDSLGSDPGGVGTGVEVQFLSTDTNVDIASAIVGALAGTGSFSGITDFAPVRAIITDAVLDPGSVTDAVDLDTGFPIVITQSGEDTITGTDPLIPLKTGIRVSYILNDTASNIAAAFQAAIGFDANYSSSVLTDTVIITNTANGAVSDITAVAFTALPLQQGVDGTSSGFDGDLYGYGSDISLVANNNITTSSINTEINATENIDLISKNTTVTATEDIVLTADKIGIQAQHAIDPIAGNEGDIYYNTDSKRFRKYDGTSWGFWDISKNNGTLALIEAKDDTLTVLPTDTSTMVDGHMVQDGDYVLFTNLTVGFDRIYKATVVITSIAWAQVPYGLSNDGTPADGDIAYIKFGNTNNDYLFSYAGSGWSVIGPRRGTNPDNSLRWSGTEWIPNDSVNIDDNLIYIRDGLASGNITIRSGNDVGFVDGDVTLDATTGIINLIGARVNIGAQSAGAPVGGNEADIYYDNLRHKLRFRDFDNYRDIDGADITSEFTGFPSRTLSVLSWDDGTRTFSITPSGVDYRYYIKGTTFVQSAVKSVTINDMTGIHFIYFDGNDLQSIVGSDPALLKDYAYVANIYWNSAEAKAIIVGDERHGLTMDWATHSYLHTNLGMRVGSGLTLYDYTETGDGSDDLHAQMALNGGTIHDEDITHLIGSSVAPSDPYEQILSPIAELPVMYKSGAEIVWTSDAATAFPFKETSSVPQYNLYDEILETWSTEDVTDGKFFVMWIFATNHMFAPIVSVMGQDEYDTLTDAEEQATYGSMVFGDMPAQEMKAIYRLIFEYNTAFTNSVDVALRKVNDIRSGIDIQLGSYTSLGDHGLLSGLTDQDHPASAIYTDVAPWGGTVLTTSETSVQLALNRLDEKAAKINLVNVEHYASDPVVVSEGQVYYNTVTKSYLYWNGTTWTPIGSGVLSNSDRNLALLGGGTKLWDSVTNTLSWSASAFVQVPSAAEDRNEILAGSAVLATDGSVAYVTINRTSGAAATLTVNVGTIASLLTASPANDNILVIARRHNGEVFWGTGDGQRMSTDGGALTKKALIDNTAAPTLIFLANAAANDTIIIKYSIKRGTNIEVGHIYMTNNGALAGIGTSSNSVGDVGTDFTADVNAGNVRLLYTTTSTGMDAEMRYSIEKWDAS